MNHKIAFFILFSYDLPAKKDFSSLICENWIGIDKRSMAELSLYVGLIEIIMILKFKQFGMILKQMKFI